MASSPSDFSSLRVEATRESEIALHARIRFKLAEALNTTDRPAWYESFAECGQTLDAGLWCIECHEWHELKHRCSMRWCPVCAWRITEKRKQQLRLWSSCVRNPMHLVLTQKNFEALTRSKLREHYKNLTKIRRHKLMSHVKGGCVSVELTNKSQGWHLHSHWLIDCDFVPMEKLAVAWGKLTGQEFGICKFNKMHGHSYVNEVCKYVCKSSELVKWEPEQILQFIESIRRTRFFFKFGSLVKATAEIKRTLAEIKVARPEKKCDHCGNESLAYIPDRGMSLDRKMKFISK